MKRCAGLVGVLGLALLLSSAAEAKTVKRRALKPTLRAGKKLAPLSIISRKQTAGMKLSKGRSILVKNNRIMVKTGKKLRPLLPTSSKFIILHNQSGFKKKTLGGLLSKAVKQNYKSLLDKSYGVRSKVLKTTKGKGGEHNVTVNLTFLRRNTWTAEDRTFVMTLNKGRRSTTLKKVVRKKAAARPRKRLRPFKTAKSMAAKKKRTIKLKTLSRKEKNFRLVAQLPIIELLKKFRPFLLGPKAKALANTAYPEVVTAKEATDQVAALFSFLIGNTAKLIGKNASSKTKILNYMKNAHNLIAWNNIGHGNPNKLCQGHGDIWHNELPTDRLCHGINGCVCLINSCQTFNDPLKASILNHQPRTYIAGIVNLPMVTSEGSNPTFWAKVLWFRKPMSVAFAETNAASGLTGYWGFWGDGGTF